MDEGQLSQNNIHNKSKGWLTSLIVHLLILLFFIFYPSFTYLDPPPPMQGIVVNFGSLDAESFENEESAAKSEETETEESISKPKPSEETSKINKTKDKPNTQFDKAIVDKSTTSEVNVKDKAQQAAEEAENQKRIEAQKEEDYKNAKSKFGKLFGNGKSTDNKSSKGDPSGKPNVDILEGVTKGSGRVGGGLSNRGLLFKPDFKDNSQKEGRVVIKVCVGPTGKVISSEYTQRGSTTSDAELIEIAIKNSKKYKFSTLEIEEQCGSITVDFKLK